MRYAPRRLIGIPAAWRRRIVFWWLAGDRSGFGFAAMCLLPVLAIVAIMAIAYTSGTRNEVVAREAAQERAAELRCLAENIYFEARGEPTEGQYAVAEVTLNRVRSPHFPKSICAVVHDTRWDPLRRRYTAHFSWTQIEARSDPWGPLWQDSIAVATAVMDDAHLPIVPDALYYHATSVQPYWASEKRSVAQIGNHVFYR
jgi:spore germination cell wall hydrolase CwlJ-like protein